MHTFVKIKGYEDQYFLLCRTEDECPNYSEFQDKMINAQKSLFSKSIADGSPLPLEVIGTRIQYAQLSNIDYVYFLHKYQQPLLIRWVGSWMNLSDTMEIEETVYSPTIVFPESKSKIVVCENDLEAPKHWIEYLNQRFPGEPISVISLFSTRTEDELREYMQGVEYITFITTFTSLQWVYKLLPHIGSKTVIGKSAFWTPEIINLFKDIKLEMI